MIFLSFSCSSISVEKFSFLFYSLFVIFKIHHWTLFDDRKEKLVTI